MTPLPITVDLLKATERFTIDIRYRVRNLWRVRLGLFLCGIGAHLLRATPVIRPFDLHATGDHWPVDVRVDDSIVGCVHIVDATTGEYLDGLKIVAANQAEGLLLCMKLDAFGRYCPSDDGMSFGYQVIRRDFRVVTKVDR